MNGRGHCGCVERLKLKIVFGTKQYRVQGLIIVWDNKIICEVMERNDANFRENKLSRKLFSDLDYGVQRNRRLLQNNHRFSEPKNRANLIKINKSKLPVDFFGKKQSLNKRTPTNKLPLPHQTIESVNSFRKADSERLHYSPEKTSFFGFFDEQQAQNGLNLNIGNKFSYRKFQTRDQPKRDAFLIESARKLTTAVKPGTNEFLQLFPSTHDERLTDIIISSAKARNVKMSPRKQIISKYREPQLIADPQKNYAQANEFDMSNQKKNVGNSVKINCVSMFDIPHEQQALNITFFNAKSTCFPPINRPNKL